MVFFVGILFTRLIVMRVCVHQIRVHCYLFVNAVIGLRYFGRFGQELNNFEVFKLVLIIWIDEVDFVARVEEIILIDIVCLVQFIIQHYVMHLYLDIWIPYLLKTALRILAHLQIIYLQLAIEVVGETYAIDHIEQAKGYCIIF